jgi:hypothetical protein
VTAAELRTRAEREAVELGPEPIDPGERGAWCEERRGAVELLAALANWDSAQLRRAALMSVDERMRREVAELLLAAASTIDSEAVHRP